MSKAYRKAIVLLVVLLSCLFAASHSPGLALVENKYFANVACSFSVKTVCETSFISSKCATNRPLSNALRQTAYVLFMRFVMLVCITLLCFTLAACSAPQYVPRSKPSKRMGPSAGEVVRFQSADGKSLEGWLWYSDQPSDSDSQEEQRLMRERSSATVLFCHGAGDSVNSPVAAFLENSGYRVFTFDYRGFGRSESAPTTNAGMTADAIAAWEYLQSRTDIDRQRIAVVGHSMGAGYALAVAAHAKNRGIPLRAVIAASGFSSWRYAASGAVPVLGYMFSTSDGLDPVDWIRDIGDTPFAIAHADDDKDVSVRNAERLLQAAKRVNVRADLLRVEKGGHGACYFLDDDFTEELLWFLDVHSLDSPREPVVHSGWRDDRSLKWIRSER